MMFFTNRIKELLLENTQKPSFKAAGILIAGGFTAYCIISAVFHFGTEQKKGQQIKIPIPKGRVPYFGHLFSLMNSFIGQVAKWHKELGPIIYVFIGVQRWLIVSDPYLAQELLSKHSSATVNRSPQTFTFGFYAQNRGISYIEVSSQWSKTRAEVLKFLGSKNRLKIRNAIERETSALVETILKISARDAGKRVSSTDDPIFTNLMTTFQEQSVHMSPLKDMKTIFPALSILDYLFHRPAMDRFLQEKFHPFYEQLLEEGLRANASCLASELQKLPHIDKKAIHVTLNDIIYPGHKLIACSIAWIVVILCCYPDTQHLLQREIDEFITAYKRLPTFEDRDHLPHLTSVQKECLRYRPVSTMGIAHGVAEDVECRGYFIPKGTILATNMVSMHMDPNIYDEPEKFIPDRFLHNPKSMAALANTAVHNRDLNVFGWGRRTCIGVFLAEMQVFDTIVHLLASCMIEPPIGQDQKPMYPDLDKFDDANGFLTPKEATVRVSKRDNALIYP